MSKKYTVEFSDRASKEMKKLDKYTAKMIYNWIDINLEGCEDPRLKGQALTGDNKAWGRYRIGDYRLICTIEDAKLVILILHAGHRRDIYDRP